jgi:hypothetical protein
MNPFIHGNTEVTSVPGLGRAGQNMDGNNA